MYLLTLANYTEGGLDKDFEKGLISIILSQQRKIYAYNVSWLDEIRMLSNNLRWRQM